MVYSVVVNMPGYLPMSDEVECYRTKREAIIAMRSHAASFREDGYLVSGRGEDGYYVERRDSAECYNISWYSFPDEEWESMGNELPE